MLKQQSFAMTKIKRPEIGYVIKKNSFVSSKCPKRKIAGFML